MLTIGKRANDEQGLTERDVEGILVHAVPPATYQGKKVLVIIPDNTRTAPVGMLFRLLYAQIGEVTRAFDLLAALGTHQPMSEEDFCRRLEMTPEERKEKFKRVRFFNHEWDNPAALKNIGSIAEEEIRRLSGGLFAMNVPVSVNRMLFEYDQVIMIGPVFPHEVVGFSGGNKYLFPGVAGPDILNFFHWLGAVTTNPKVIGHKRTPVRQVVDHAGGMVPIDKLCFCLIVSDGKLAGLYTGKPEAAWNAAADLSAQLHVVIKKKPFHTILSCAPEMYDELWTGGKCMYKLEPVLADDGELIIYAPHIKTVSETHGRILMEIGYHCRDYYLKQWDRFKHYPWGVLAHSCHVYGQGAFENGVERPRAKVTLATGIPEEVCRKINLGYRDPATIHPEDYARKEKDGILLVKKAGEMLYRLQKPPAWAA